MEGVMQSNQSWGVLKSYMLISTIGSLAMLCILLKRNPTHKKSWLFILLSGYLSDGTTTDCHQHLSWSSFFFQFPHPIHHHLLFPPPLFCSPVFNPGRYCRHIFIIFERLRAHCALMSLWTVAPLIQRKMLSRMEWSVRIALLAARGRGWCNFTFVIIILEVFNVIQRQACQN